MGIRTYCGKKEYSVAILLCTYNSKKFLGEQLDSIKRQSHAHWRVWISDDGSQDNTLDIIKSYREAWGKDKISVQPGPQQGFALNFLSLVNDNSIQKDYYAYSDHDDIWRDNKLKDALKWLDTISEGTPALYCSRTCLVDDDLKKLGFSPLFSRPPSFANAIVQNIGGGNTMVFNNAARALLQKVNSSNGIVSHDWLTYQVVMACGGEVFYDQSPTVNYRQHTNNLVGANNHWLSRIKRMRMLYHGTFKDWNSSNILAMQSISTDLDENSSTIMDHVCLLREASLCSRLKGLINLKVHRQTWLGNVGLLIAIIFRRF